MVTINDIVEAHRRIRGYVHETPVLTSQRVNDALGCDVLFKCENLQKVGAFKARGACNAVLGLSDHDSARGVATHSSGNHGAALAYAASIRGIRAYVVMPTSAPTVKRDAVRSYGAQIVDCAPYQADRERTVAEVVAETGAHLVPPYDDDRVIAGQGTATLELLGQIEGPSPEVVMAPVGGGGLLAGTAIATKAIAPSSTIIAAEPAGADDTARSLHAGRRVDSVDPQTIADGLRTLVGVRPFEVISTHVDEVLTVQEATIVEAMVLIWTRMKLIIEPSAAVPVAAMIENPTTFAGRRVAVILSGGNVDPHALPWSPSASW